MMAGLAAVGFAALLALAAWLVGRIDRGTAETYSDWSDRNWH